MDLLWSSLYLPTGDTKSVKTALAELHTTAGYQAYNPFPGGTGTPINATNFVRLFIAPPENGWIRLIGEPNRDLLPDLAQNLGMGVIFAWVSTDQSEVEVFGGTLDQFLREGKSEAAFEPDFSQPPETNAPTMISSIAQQYGIDPKQAGGLIEKTTKSLFGKMNGADQMDAAAALANKQMFSWQMPNAQRVWTIMQSLRLPQTWHNPDYKELSAAYQIACLLDMDENATLLPGDEAILDKVEYPLDYELAFYAR